MLDENKVHVNVDVNDFTWDKEEGLFLLDGSPALLFWDSAIELFLSTIEEVSGEDVSTTVFEATGFRMGQLVSAFYAEKFSIDSIIHHYSSIYRNCGWGNVHIASFSEEERSVTVQLTNSWEHRIFSSLERQQAGVILPSHWAGVFSGLFGENMWYKIEKSQLNGEPYDEIHIFPSDTTPAQNIHNLTRQKEQQQINMLEAQVQQRTTELSGLVKELSTPVIPVLEDILVLPLMGRFTEERFESLIHTALDALTQRKAQYMIFDLTAINEIEEYTIYNLHRLTQAIGLLGAKSILVGISPALALKTTQLQEPMKDITFFATLQHGVEHALYQTGYDIVKRNG